MTDFMSKAHALRNAVNWNSNESVEVIAEALRANFAAGQEDILRRLREPSGAAHASAAMAIQLHHMEDIPITECVSTSDAHLALTAAADAIEREIKG